MTIENTLSNPHAAMSQHLHGDGDDLQLESWALEILNRTPGQWITTDTYEMRAALDRIWVKGLVEKWWLHGKNAYRVSAIRAALVEDGPDGR